MSEHVFVSFNYSPETELLMERASLALAVARRELVKLSKALGQTRELIDDGQYASRFEVARPANTRAKG